MVLLHETPIFLLLLSDLLHVKLALQLQFAKSRSDLYFFGVD